MGIKTAVAFFAIGIVLIGLLTALKDQIEQRKSVSTHQMHGPYERYWKRPLDAMLAAAALVILFPVLLITALLVRVHLGSPVIFRQERPGKDEKIFRLYKFRSMTNQRDEHGELLPDEKRMTPFSRMLRSTSLDELPELWNILKGEMSFVGPRPLLVRYLDRYSPEERRRHEVRPGLTGLAMSKVRNGAGWDKKFELDLQYIDQVSFALDCKIIFWTIGIVLRREGINEDGYATNSEFLGRHK